MESDTPRTDAENCIRALGFEKWVSIEFARELERELAAEGATTASLLRIIALIREAGGFTREDLAALPGAVKAMRQQRDEAQRWLRDACAEIARIEARFYDALTPQQIAERNGWNCFGEKEGGGA